MATNVTQVFFIIFLVFLVVGGLNWGLYAIDPSYNLVDMLFGSGSILAKLVYAVVAISAIAVVALSIATPSKIYVQ